MGVWTIALSSGLIAAGAQAAPSALDRVTACRAIAEGPARLACFDEAVTRLSDQVSKRDVVVLDRQEVRRTRRSLFGFNLPRLAFLAGDDGDEPEAKELTGQIARATELEFGRYVITLENGAVWRTTEPARTVPKAGRAVTLRRAALGSYFMDYGPGRSVRAMRIQ